MNRKERGLRPSTAARAAAAEGGPFHSARRTNSHVLGRGSVALVGRVEQREHRADEAAQCMQVAPDHRQRLVCVILVIESRVLLFELNDEYAPNRPCWSLPCSVAPSGFQTAPAAETLYADTSIRLPNVCFQFVQAAQRTESGPAFISYYRVRRVPHDINWGEISLPPGAKGSRWFQEDEIATLPLYSDSDAVAIRSVLRDQHDD